MSRPFALLVQMKRSSFFWQEETNFDQFRFQQEQPAGRSRLQHAQTAEQVFELKTSQLVGTEAASGFAPAQKQQRIWSFSFFRR